MYKVYIYKICRITLPLYLLRILNSCDTPKTYYRPLSKVNRWCQLWWLSLRQSHMVSSYISNTFKLLYSQCHYFYAVGLTFTRNCCQKFGPVVDTISSLVIHVHSPYPHDHLVMSQLLLLNYYELLSSCTME